MRWKRGNRLKFVAEVDAPAATRQIFDEVRHALGAPTVPFLYQVYAAYPAFLQLHWKAFQPAMGTQKFFQLAGRLGAEAYTRAHNYFEVRDLVSRQGLVTAYSGSGPDLSLTKVLDYYQYLDPLLLLIAAAQMQALEGPIGRELDITEGGDHPVFLAAPPLLSEEGAPASVQRIWDDRRRRLELAFLSDEHRALATWAPFYQDYWMALRELAQSPLYNDCQYRISESAWGLARELPGPVETSVPQLLEAGLTEEEVSSLARMNETIVHSLSALVLDIVFARIGWEGGTHPSAPGEEHASEGAERGQIGSPPRAA